MATLRLSVGKKIEESFKASCRLFCRPILPILPESFANRFPFLGRVSIQGPDNLRLHFYTHGPHGKDRIAIKLARRGLWGYEGETIRVFMELARQARTVIDIGANTGLFALLAARLNPSCRVWAFEPVPFIFDMLRKNVRLNQLTNLECLPFAVGDFSGTTTFFITRTNVGIPTDSSSCPGFRDQVEEILVPTTTLDEYVGRQRLARLDVLKIDAEASESRVILGAQQTMRQHRPFIICEVLERVDHGCLQRALEGLEYRFFHLAPGCLTRHPHLQGSLAVDQRNYLFVPAEKEPLVANICRAAAIRMGG